MKQQPATVATMLSASLFALAISGGSTQVTRAHLSPEGARCINYDGVQYDRTTDWNFAVFINLCDFPITIDYTRFDPVDRRTLTNSVTVPARVNNRTTSRVTANLFKSTSLQWAERFAD